MEALRIETTITGDTIVLPELKRWQGKTVEIVVTEIPKSSVGVNDAIRPISLAGTVVHFLEPFAPAIDADEWEVGR